MAATVSVWKVTTERSDKPLGEGRYAYKFFSTDQEAWEYIKNPGIPMIWYALTKASIPLTKNSLVEALNGQFADLIKGASEHYVTVQKVEA